MKNKKKCSICGEEKLLNKFYKQKNGYLGRRANCKVCSNKKVKKWKSEHPNYDKEYQKKYFKNNKEKIIKHSKEYYIENKEVRLEYGKEYYVNNKDKLNEYGKKYYIKHNISSKEYGKIWRNNNKDKCRTYAINRNHKNLELSAIKWMRNFLYRTEKQGFIKNKLNTISEFGYTPKQLIDRIECQFKEGMSWNNRKKWHIDHKKPISKFIKGTSPRTINMLCNLQPIWANDNLIKGNLFN
jgi:hypothetical protein